MQAIGFRSKEGLSGGGATLVRITAREEASCRRAVGEAEEEKQGKSSQRRRAASRHPYRFPGLNYAGFSIVEEEKSCTGG
jgi:hypothetical protein